MFSAEPSLNCKFFGYLDRVGLDSNIQSHAHEWHVVGLPVSRPITIFTNDRLLTVPKATAVWMPAGVQHRATCQEVGEVRSVAVPPSIYWQAPKAPCLLKTTSFMRELIGHMASLDLAEVSSAYGDRLAGVLSVHTKEAGLPQVSMRMPADRRLRGIAEVLMADPFDDRTLHDWATVVGASYRTLARHFVLETGMTFQHWRQTLLVAEAVKRLADAQPISVIAAELGYSSAAGFTTMFKRVMSISPSDYCRRLHSASC